MKVLITGPSGAGKTYISSALRAKGINAQDADTIEGLADYFDGDGNVVHVPTEQMDEEFLNTHEFLWRRDFLKKYLDKQNNIYLFGMSGNVFDLVDLFDKAYFLQAPQALLAERLRHESRENKMGRTDFQLENALNWAKEIEKKARVAGMEMLDATLAPEEILQIISR